MRDFHKLYHKFWILLTSCIYNLVDFSLLKRSLIFDLMLLVFNSGRYKHLQSLLRTITKRFTIWCLPMFLDFWSMFLTKEFVDPKGMFQKICRQQPFEFLITFNFCREKKNDFEDFNVSLL